MAEQREQWGNLQGDAGTSRAHSGSQNGGVESIVETIAAGLDTSCAEVRFAVEDLRERLVGASAGSSMTLRPLASEEARAAVVRYLRESLQLRIAERRLGRAKAKADLALHEAKEAVREQEEVDTEGLWELDAHRFAIVDTTASCALGDDALALLQFSSAMVRGADHEELSQLEEGEFPPDLRDLTSRIGGGTREFIRELAHYLTESGNEGRALLERIDRARGLDEVCGDSNEVPRPVRFFAELAAKYPVEKEH